jgi:hypothetical protein
MNHRSGPSLQVVARYDARGGMQLEGGPVELRQLAEVIRAARPEGAEYSLTTPEGADPRPYDGFLYSMAVSATDELVHVTRQSDSIHIAGSRAGLALLSQSILHVADQAETNSLTGSVNYHVHIEYHEGHPFLGTGSEPFTIMLRNARRQF